MPSATAAASTKLKARRRLFGGPAEVGAGNERHACRLGASEQLDRIDAVRELDPQEVAALGTRPAGCVAELALERGEHRVPACSQLGADALEIGLEQPAAHELVHGRLADERRRDVRGSRPRRSRRTPGRRGGRGIRRGRPARSSSRRTSRRRFPPRRRARRWSAATRPRSGRGRRDRPRRPPVRARGPARRACADARSRASGRTGSGRWESCRGTKQAGRRGAPTRERRRRGPPRRAGSRARRRRGRRAA